MALDVKVSIDLTKPIGKAGFGYPLILGLAGEGETAIAYTVCYSLADVTTAGITENSDMYNTIALMLAQEDAPEKFAIALSAEETAVSAITALVDEDWRQLIYIGTADETIATYIETTDKLYFASTTTKPASTASDSVVGKGKDRTIIFYCDENVGETAQPEAAIVGATAGLDAGSFTYKNIILTDDVVSVLTDTEITTLSDCGIIAAVTKAGDVVTTEGKSRDNEYIDVIDTQDYIVQNLEYNTQKTLNNAKKIPYDNNGIAILESVAIGVMQDAFNKGMIAVDEKGSPMYTVHYDLREDCDSSDISIRKYIGGQFSFTLSGAIHEVEVTGEIEL